VGDFSRRSFVTRAASAAIAAPFVLRHSYRLFAQSRQEYPERVVRLMRESLVIDMLNQFLYRIDQKDLKEKWLTQASAFTEADFLKFKSSGVSVMNFGSACCEA
jgi:hypothetical protein